MNTFEDTRNFVENLSGNIGAQMTEKDIEEMEKIKEKGFNEGEAFYQHFFE